MNTSEKRESMILLVRQWKSSGLTQAKFAEQNSLTRVKFRYWTKKLKELAGEEPGFIQINGFTPQSISLLFPNGVELLLPIQTPVLVLNALIYFQTRCSRKPQRDIFCIGK